MKVSLAPGKYNIRLTDSYGDGGINGILKQGNTTILDFKWTNLDWSKNNGYNQNFSFTVFNLFIVLNFISFSFFFL